MSLITYSLSVFTLNFDFFKVSMVNKVTLEHQNCHAIQWLIAVLRYERLKFYSHRNMIVYNNKGKLVGSLLRNDFIKVNYRAWSVFAAP